MKTLLLCVLMCLVTRSYGLERGDLEKFGPFQMILHSGLIKCNHDRSLNLDVSGVNVYFYDFPRNIVEAFPIYEAARGILDYPDLDKTKQFIIYVGGYTSSINRESEELVRSAFRNYSNSYLIILDHSPYTNNNDGKVESYERSVTYVHYIGKALGQMLAGLAQGGISPKNMHVIGHSLGAHISGNAGETFTTLTGEKIAMITGLDPAGPCFSDNSMQVQVRSGLADYVEIYHCNAGALGTTNVLGDVDFFVNKKGETQPNCGTPLIPGFSQSSKAAICSHYACINYWIATVNNPNWYLAQKCDSYKHFKEGRCARNDATMAGFWNPGNAIGVFYFNTEDY